MQNSMILEDDHPVFNACEIGDLNAAEKCFREGISVHSESEHNASLIGIAAFHENKKLIELMLKYGLDINRPYNRFGASVAEFAIHRDSIEWLEYFFQLGVPVNALDGTGHSFLEIAAGGGKLRCLVYLLEKGSKLEHSSPTGGTAFRQASRNNQTAAMQLLWERGADIETRDSTLTTPLIGSAKGGKYEAAEWLLDHGADILAEDERGKTAEDWARANGHQKVVELLQSRMGS